MEFPFIFFLPEWTFSPSGCQGNTTGGWSSRYNSVIQFWVLSLVLAGYAKTGSPANRETWLEVEDCDQTDFMMNLSGWQKHIEKLVGSSGEIVRCQTDSSLTASDWANISLHGQGQCQQKSLSRKISLISVLGWQISKMHEIYWWRTSHYTETRLTFNVIWSKCLDKL